MLEYLLILCGVTLLSVSSVGPRDSTPVTAGPGGSPPLRGLDGGLRLEIRTDEEERLRGGERELLELRELRLLRLDTEEFRLERRESLLLDTDRVLGGGFGDSAFAGPSSSSLIRLNSMSTSCSCSPSSELSSTSISLEKIHKK